ncbi:MAG: sensor histidine kinase N-terminal domain-containing protein [Gammaproteobacteria bacterium]|nr:sensor histidine kinase N-terminal domain-containing protein [Gammaproteobacteria bacterium]
MKSIRSYLVIAVLSAITLTSFVAALYGYRTSVAAAQTLFDAQLSDTASLIAALLAAQPPETTSEADRGLTPSAGQAAFQIWTEDQRLILYSADAPTTAIAPFEPGFHDRNFNNQRWRVLVRHAQASDHWILVAQRADTRYLLADSIVMESVLAVVVSLPVAALFIWIIVGHGLRLLARLASQLRHKKAADLSPLDLDDPPEELAVIVAAVNALLNRLARSFARERRLTADAAHELRTPIAALKIHLHNLAAKLPPGDPTLAQLQAEATRLEHLITQILLLYRMEPEHYRATMEVLDLTEIARQTVANRYAEFECKEQEIHFEGHSQPILGDRFAITTLVDNLVANASRYTPMGGQIAVATSATTERVILEISDSGPGMAESERERVFDRFYRIGGDRNPASGSGLGLSIVKLIADLHRATIRFGASAFGTGLSVRVEFPLSEEAAVATPDGSA